MKIKFVNSSKITWNVMPGNPGVDWLQVYCPDGDGILQVAVYSDRVELLDQMETKKIWPVDFDIVEILEFAENYCYEIYPFIYVDAMHLEHEETIEEQRALMNHINGYSHLNNSLF